jgi:uncharacterized protein (DUF305 family)
MKPIIQHLTVAALGAAALALAGCGQSEEPAPAADTTAAPTVTDGAAAFNDGDVEFVQGMIPHHDQALQMADIALDPTVGAGGEVRALAEEVRAAQDPEIELMTRWLNEWGQPMHMDTSDGHDMSSMEGMMSDADMEALAAARGDDFDRMWLEMMIRHHEGAIATAETAKAEASNPEVIELANEVIVAQQAEIDRMDALLRE